MYLAKWDPILLFVQVADAQSCLERTCATAAPFPARSLAGRWQGLDELDGRRFVPALERVLDRLQQIEPHMSVAGFVERVHPGCQRTFRGHRAGCPSLLLRLTTLHEIRREYQPRMWLHGCVRR